MAEVFIVYIFCNNRCLPLPTRNIQYSQKYFCAINIVNHPQMFLHLPSNIVNHPQMFLHLPSIFTMNIPPPQPRKSLKESNLRLRQKDNENTICLYTSWEALDFMTRPFPFSQSASSPPAIVYVFRQGPRAPDPAFLGTQPSNNIVCSRNSDALQLMGKQAS